MLEYIRTLLRRSTNGMFATLEEAQRRAFDTNDMGEWMAACRFASLNR